MEKQFSIRIGGQPVGKVQILRQGLYYRFVCRCSLSGDILYRLVVTCGGNRENLGILVPMDGGFGLDTKIAVKRIGEGAMEFALVPKHELLTGKFVVIYPDEPFAYISHLKESYLTIRNDQKGIIMKKTQER